MTKGILIAFVSLAAAGCASKPGSGSGSGSDPEGVDSGVAADSGPVADCGSYGFKMSGAVAFTSPVSATATRDGAVIGVVGYDATAAYTLAIWDSLTADLDGVGTHDVSTAHLDFLQMPPNGVCSTPGTCPGFVATSGSFVVSSIAPYAATFTLGDLYARDGSSTDVGAAIAGEVTGCLATE